MRTWLICHYDRQFWSLSEVVHAEWRVMDEFECEGLPDCLEKMHARMYTAVLVEPGNDWCYTIEVVEDDGTRTPYYVLMRDKKDGQLRMLATPDVHSFFDEFNPQWRDQIVISDRPEE